MVNFMPTRSVAEYYSWTRASKEEELPPLLPDQRLVFLMYSKAESSIIYQVIMWRKVKIDTRSVGRECHFSVVTV